MDKNMFIDIKGYEGLYKINRFGVVLSQYRGKCLKPFLANGYYKLVLVKDKIQKKHYIHRLVAENFLVSNTTNNIVNHIDGNRLNNDVSNLEWVTYKGNAQHALNVLETLAFGEQSYNTELTNNQVRKIFVDDRTDIEVSKDYNVTRGVISDIKSGRRWGKITEDIIHVRKYNSVKFSDEIVDKIRVDNRSYKEIKSEYGISYASISNIKHNKRRIKNS